MEGLDLAIRAMHWLNPKTNEFVNLGEHIGNGHFINPAFNNLEQEVELLDNPSGGKLIGAGKEGKAYLHDSGKRQLVAKHYLNVAGLPYDSRATGVSQFRCMRKIKLLGFEAPTVYAASLEVLIMDYVPYESLETYSKKISPEKMVEINREWLNLIIKELYPQIPGENIDFALSNGYIKHTNSGYKLGIIDHG